LKKSWRIKNTGTGFIVALTAVWPSGLMQERAVEIPVKHPANKKSRHVGRLVGGSLSHQARQSIFFVGLSWAWG